LEPQILIVSERGDVHSEAMAATLRKEHGVDPYQLSMQEFPQLATATFFSGKKHKAIFNGPSGSIDLTKVKSVWWRRPERCAVPNNFSVDRNFCQNECDHFLQGLLWSTDCFWVNYPIYDVLASRKIVQLIQAKQAGLLVPRTIVTNNPKEARRFVKANRGSVVFKRTGFSSVAFSKTTLFTPETDQHLESIVLAPTTFQEYIKGGFDVRVIYIAGKMFAVAIDSNASATPEDCRFDLSVSHKHCVLPSPLQESLKRLMVNLRLVFGAVDFKVNQDGKYYFLEVNPSGQFAYLELKTGLPLMSTLASVLIHQGNL
jgi:hypothetical protein